MNTVLKTIGCVLLLSSTSGPVLAQQTQAPAPVPSAPAPAAPKSNAQLDAGEPRANSAPSDGSTAVAAPPAHPAAAAGRSPPKSAAAPRGQGAAAAAAGTAGQRGSSAADRVNLNTATVTGDREQPKVMYIVPWKSSNIGDPSGKPMNSLLDEALAPVDREEFKREVAYYDAVRADTPSKAGPPSAGQQGEK